MVGTTSRRAFLVAAGAVLTEGCARSTRSIGIPPAVGQLEQLERRVGGRMGVFAVDSSSGASIEYRADERFAMCSTFKWALVAALLARVDRGELVLEQTVSYGEQDLLSYAPLTRAHLAEGKLTLDELAGASVTVSDNTAANLLLAHTGGPEALTRFFRSIGDDVTRLDRNEPTLNSNLPGDARDTTTPRAMALALRAVLTGSVLSRAGRERLTRWLVECQTGVSRLRAGFPSDWKCGDKTGTGERGSCNDVAIVWPPAGAPWLIAAYMSDSSASTSDLSSALADVGRLVATRVLSGRS